MRKTTMTAFWVFVHITAWIGILTLVGEDNLVDRNVLKLERMPADIAS